MFYLNLFWLNYIYLSNTTTYISLSYNMSLIVSSDEHTLTVKVHPVVTQEQLSAALQSALSAASSMGPEYQTKFMINMVKKKGVRTGRGFVWLSNPKVYHMILGRNPDGSPRIRRYKDPNWIAPEVDPFANLGKGKSWADMMEEEEAQQAPIIEEQLPPLVTVPTIKLTPEQQAQHEEKATEVSIHIEAALAHDVEVGFSHNILRSSALLPFMDEKFIKNEFQCFSTSKNTLPIRTGPTKKDIVNETFPYVKIVTHNTPRGPERVAYVTFDSATRDASFAFHMMRQREYKNSKTQQTFIVNYTYAKSRIS
jgi:hypothetical protein